MEVENQIGLLYVDDEEMNVFLFERHFKSYYRVYTAKSGAEGLDILNEFNSDIRVVISDMRMPGMNGIEFIKEARKKSPEKAYFILTGYDYYEEVYYAMKEKIIHQFFTKPFDVQLIKQGVDEVIDDMDRKD